MELTDKNEQRLSLNGSFGMLAYLIQEIDNKKLQQLMKWGKL